MHMSKRKINPLTRDFYERYIRFSEILHNAWITFKVQDEVVRIIETQSNAEPLRSSIILETASPVSAGNRAPSRIPGNNLPGIVRRAFKSDMPVSILLNAIGLFEALIGDVARIAYVSEPERFLLRGFNKTGDVENVGEKENVKLLETLINSTTREEAIERYVEERLRGIFYGNPSDLFDKNRLGFDLYKTMATKCKGEINLFKEITARRNVIVHNLGRIDNKYVREIKGTDFNPGDKVTVDAQYLFDALRTLNILAVHYVNAVSMCTVHEPLPSRRTAHIISA